MVDRIKIIYEPLNFDSPKGPMALTKADVWGQYNHNHERISSGMVVASHDQTCPYFHDTVPYKSATLKGSLFQENQISYWAEYVQGAGCISQRKTIGEQVIIRTDYMAW